MKKTILCALLALVLAVCAVPLSACAPKGSVEIKEQALRDKIAGGVMGHVAGLLSGYEFNTRADGSPLVPVPEHWYGFLYGPYGYGTSHGGAGTSVIYDGEVMGDDDYHVDFFNQLILRQKGHMPDRRDIADMWVEYEVSDWGGGFCGLGIAQGGEIPPFTGLYEYGNVWHWCTEAYIENETLGLSAPGMPGTAWELADRFASMTGDFDSLSWARFWAVCYSQAFFSSDAASLITSCLGALPPYSWARRVAETCLELYERQPDDWERSLHAVEAMRREIFDCNNILCSPDVNNGFAILALLYGRNDFAEAVRLASISGYDGDCTAATVGGLMGILVGIDGLPKELDEEIYHGGEGVYRNSATVVPHIGGAYPKTQTWREVIDLYYGNAKAVLERGGSKRSGSTWHIVQESLPEMKGVPVPNGDFEDRTVSYPGAGYGVGEAHDGAGYLELAEGGRLEIPVTGLEPGAWYELSAYVHTGKDNGGYLFVSGDGGEERVAFYDTIYQATPQMNAKYGFVQRKFLFRASSASAVVGVSRQERAGTVAVDDITLTRVRAEPGAQSYDMGGAFNTAVDGENLYLEIAYSSGTDAMVKTYVLLDGEPYCVVGLPQTGQGQNLVYLPIQPGKGKFEFQLNSMGIVEGTCRIVGIRY